jgi:hypothetical protein
MVVAMVVEAMVAMKAVVAVKAPTCQGWCWTHAEQHHAYE